jgi:hypothetical protein
LRISIRGRGIGANSSDSRQMSEAAFQRPPRYDTPTPAR